MATQEVTKQYGRMWRELNSSYPWDEMSNEHWKKYKEWYRRKAWTAFEFSSFDAEPIFRLALPLLRKQQENNERIATVIDVMHRSHSQNQHDLNQQQTKSKFYALSGDVVSVICRYCGSLAPSLFVPTGQHLVLQHQCTKGRTDFQMEFDHIFLAKGSQLRFVHDTNCVACRKRRPRDPDPVFKIKCHGFVIIGKKSWIEAGCKRYSIHCDTLLNWSQYTSVFGLHNMNYRYQYYHDYKGQRHQNTTETSSNFSVLEVFYK